jgi:hypothetical protein
MKRAIIVLMLLALSFGFVGCEDTDEYLLDAKGVVEYVNDPDTPSVWSEIVTTRGKYIHVLDTTSIMVERQSGSGFSPGETSDIYPGRNIQWYYYDSEIDYNANPIVTPAVKIIVSD